MYGIFFSVLECNTGEPMKTIEQIKQELLHRQSHHDPVSAEELFDVLEEMGLSEEESASFYEWCEENGIGEETVSLPQDLPAGASLDAVNLYLHEIGQIPLLTPEEERRTAEKAQKGDKEAMDLLTRSNLRLVVSIARNYMNRGLALPDLIQEGNIGLMHAVEKFDWSKGFRFSTYATWWIKQSMIRAIGEQARYIRLPVHLNEQLMKIHKVRTRLTQELNHEPDSAEIAAQIPGMTAERVEELLKLSMDTVSLETPVGDDDSSTLSDFVADDTLKNPEQVSLEAYRREEVHEMLKELPEREQEILKARFGLDGQEPQTLEEVGKRLNVTKERVRQLENRAIRRLAGNYRRDDYE